MIDAAGFRDLDEYRAVQARANVRKANRVWARPGVMQRVAEIAASVADDPAAGPRLVICHGVRNGAELGMLRRHLPDACTLIGTDIGPSANWFEGVERWDFHEPNPAWSGRADAVFTNSWDHAYDIGRALAAWRDAAKPGGAIVLEWTVGHVEAEPGSCDCFGADRAALEAELRTAGLADVRAEELPLLREEASGEVRYRTVPDAPEERRPIEQSGPHLGRWLVWGRRGEE